MASIREQSEKKESNDQPEFYTKAELDDITKNIRCYMTYKPEDLMHEFKSEKIDDLTKNCMFTALIANDAKERGFDTKIVDAYVTYPPFMFYTDPNNLAIRRIYGFCITDDGEVRAHAVTAMFIMNNDIIGGIELEMLVHVKRWSNNQLDKLNCGMVKGANAFLEQCGWLHFAR
jgi:hypothetical protein